MVLHCTAVQNPRESYDFAATPLSTLAVYYMMEALPKHMAPVALLIGFAGLQLPGPLSRVRAPDLQDIIDYLLP